MYCSMVMSFGAHSLSVVWRLSVSRRVRYERLHCTSPNRPDLPALMGFMMIMMV